MQPDQVMSCVLPIVQLAPAVGEDIVIAHELPPPVQDMEQPASLKQCIPKSFEYPVGPQVPPLHDAFATHPPPTGGPPPQEVIHAASDQQFMPPSREKLLPVQEGHDGANT